MDFTIKKYKELLASIKESDYAIQNMVGFMSAPAPRVIAFRHDVDERPANALQMAKAEQEAGICSTFYFRIGKISNNPEVIKSIADMGHEIGYHYEDFAACQGDVHKAAGQFKRNLAYFRQYYPVKTVCMHGSSMSDFDNRHFWNHCDLSDFGLIGEPYLSIDYSDVLYLTDTARTWDGGKYSIRDKVQKNYCVTGLGKTDDIIRRLKKNDLPDRIVLQSHTLWTDDLSEWMWLETREFVRNRLKRVLQHFPWMKNKALKAIQRYSN